VIGAMANALGALLGTAAGAAAMRWRVRKALLRAQ
jgi:hypothetical protein